MSVLRRLFVGEPRPVPQAPLIKIGSRPVPVMELEDEGSFATAIQQAEAIRRNAPGRGERRQLCEVVIQVGEREDAFRDVEVFWRGAWRPSWEGGVPLPSRDDLEEVARINRARFARSQVRFTI
jgi:hypothetical protein